MTLYTCTQVPSTQQAIAISIKLSWSNDHYVVCICNSYVPYRVEQGHCGKGQLDANIGCDGHISNTYHNGDSWPPKLTSADVNCNSATEPCYDVIDGYMSCKPEEDNDYLWPIVQWQHGVNIIYIYINTKVHLIFHDYICIWSLCAIHSHFAKLSANHAIYSYINNHLDWQLCGGSTHCLNLNCPFSQTGVYKQLIQHGTHLAT